MIWKVNYSKKIDITKGIDYSVDFKLDYWRYLEKLMNRDEITEKVNDFPKSVKFCIPKNFLDNKVFSSKGTKIIKNSLKPSFLTNYQEFGAVITGKLKFYSKQVIPIEDCIDLSGLDNLISNYIFCENKKY